MSDFDELHEEILRRLSKPRMAPYLAECGEDLSAALRLYLWNIRVGSAFFESLHLLEVGVRNAIHDVLTDRQQQLGVPVPWYRDRTLRLAARARDRISVARGQATKGGIPEVPDKVVAELTLGFWAALFAHGYNRTLWQPYLQRAFDPNARRHQLHADLQELTQLRNRIAHHEPCHQRDLATDYLRIRRVAGHLSPEFEDFIVRTTQIETVLDDRPQT